MGSRLPKTKIAGNMVSDSTTSGAATNINGRPRGQHTSQDGDGCLTGGGGDSDDEDDDITTGDVNAVAGADSAAVQKKRKKSNKKKKKKGKKTQSSPPRVPLSDLFPSGNFAEGQVQQYTRTATAEAEARDAAKAAKFDDEFLRNYRKAAEVHRQTRKWVQDTVKPGHKLRDVAEGIEDSVRALLGHPGLEPGDSLKAGMGFPTGLCLNNQVAHYTPNPGQKDVVLEQQDVMKVDFGVHINGWIVDSAFTMAFDPVYDDLLAAVKDATNTGIRTAGVDVRICDVSAAIQEAMESHEVEIRGKTYPVKPVRNLSAHDIVQYHIHGGKSIPFVKNSDQTKMEAGEVYAIETFGSTGRGSTRDEPGIYGYGLIDAAPLKIDLALASAKRLHKTIRENFGTIVFCRRYLDRLGCEKYLAGMNCLIQNGIVEPYGQLMDVKGSYSAQFEHTILLRDTHKEVVSRGDDY